MRENVVPLRRETSDDSDRIRRPEALEETRSYLETARAIEPDDVVSVVSVVVHGSKPPTLLWTEGTTWHDLSEATASISSLRYARNRYSNEDLRPQEIVDEAWTRRRRHELAEKNRIEAEKKATPYVCSCGRRFRTERGHGQHAAAGRRAANHYRTDGTLEPHELVEAEIVDFGIRR